MLTQYTLDHQVAHSDNTGVTTITAEAVCNKNTKKQQWLYKLCLHTLHYR